MDLGVDFLQQKDHKGRFLSCTFLLLAQVSANPK